VVARRCRQDRRAFLVLGEVQMRHGGTGPASFAHEWAGVTPKTRFGCQPGIDGGSSIGRAAGGTPERERKRGDARVEPT